jgi:2-polyprenyl-6-methoxyphenol hydroxylase-like FAD-dependent oxidoreductase
MSRVYDVLIVGGGPVGVALAVDLGLRGIRCAIVERRTGLGNIPKGQNLTQRTLEHFYFWGVEPEIRAARMMPKDYPIGELTAHGDLMSPYWYASAGREVVRPYYFQDNERLPQYRTEEVLRRKLDSLPSVDQFFGWNAQALMQDESGVHLTISQEGSSESLRLEAQYLVGCDGGRSLVREEVGIGRGGTDFDARMALVVFRSRELHEKLKRFPERSTYRVMHPKHNGYWQFFGRIDVGEGWFFHAPVPPEADESFDFKGLVQDAAGFEFACTFDYVGFWDLRVSVAEKYQVDRVFIAGDAAHTHPPYGGFGLNNGLEDATNLGWKLAAVLHGWGGPALLASYSEERRPIFKETAEDFIAARIRADGAFLNRYQPERDSAEFEQAWNARQNESGTRAFQYEPHYEGSTVIAGPPGGKCSARGTHEFQARAGHHLAPQALSTGRNVFEELGADFTLLAFGADEATVAAFERAAESTKIPLKILRDSDEEGRKAYAARLILVRPDQYVVWTGDEAPADAQRVLQMAAGR